MLTYQCRAWATCRRILGQNHEACNYETLIQNRGEGLLGSGTDQTYSYTQVHGISCLKETLIRTVVATGNCQNCLLT